MTIVNRISEAEETYRGGVVPVACLPGVAIDLDALLDGWAGNPQPFASYYVGDHQLLEPARRRSVARASPASPLRPLV